MVLMALFTTFITTPAISFLYPPQYYEKDLHESKTHKTSAKIDYEKTVSVTDILSDIISPKESMKILVCVDDIKPVPMMARLIWLFQSAKSAVLDLRLTALKVRVCIYKSWIWAANLEA